MNNDRKFVSGSSDFIMHFGIIGQKWGVRRFQNPDGTLTPEGRQRYLQESTNEKGEKEVVGVAKAGLKEFFKGGGKSSELTREGEEFRSNVHNDKDLRTAINRLQYARKYSEKWADIYNEAADYFNSRIGAINDKWPNPGETKERYRQYCKEVCEVYQRGYRDVLIKNLGNFPSDNENDVHEFLRAYGLGYAEIEKDLDD